MCYLFHLKRRLNRKISSSIGSENYRSGVMTSARIQPISKKDNINIGCFDGRRINPRNITQRSTSLFIHINHFCLVRKSNGISFNEVIEKELKPNFRVIDKCISYKPVKSFNDYEYKP